ncbi:MAG TPA: acetyltransferase [bacterium]|nr:acetyltransferase [bacterium]HNH33899.1 acetyltransferase [bacterium]HNO70577.1 acetyltransferase [Bacteroidia bacterium]
MKKIVIFGAGDIARLAHYYFKTDSNYEVVAFTVDREYVKSDNFLDLPLVVFDDIEKKYPPSEFGMFVALSYAKLNKARAEKYVETKKRGYTLVNYISTRCSNLTQFPIGDNCFILEDNTIQPYVRIGNNVTLWSGNHIGHDSVIEDHNFISSHVVISGHCTIKSYCFLGVNATLRNGITIAEENIIGAGAIIMKNTKHKDVYLPAKSVLFDKQSDAVDL